MAWRCGRGALNHPIGCHHHRTQMLISPWDQMAKKRRGRRKVWAGCCPFESRILEFFISHINNFILIMTRKSGKTHEQDQGWKLSRIIEKDNQSTTLRSSYLTRDKEAKEARERGKNFSYSKNSLMCALSQWDNRYLFICMVKRRGISLFQSNDELMSTHYSEAHI